ncbi:hypothetical protein SAMN05880582_102140 [Rhizobium sp. RU20A]|nr:hypothetical protein SAMN05880582_102140 [Rhizobium sp. RU20A]
MTDHDADEIVPQRKRREKTPTIDKVLGVTGVALAAFGTFFPWYAFFNQDKFHLPTLWQGDVRDLPEQPGPAVVTVSPLAMPDAGDGARQATRQAAIDQITTATVPGINDDGTRPGEGEAGLDQPFPASNAFRLMHVANGRALIEDKTGMYIVRVGAVLPDNSRLATLEEREGQWVLITSKGQVFKAQ